MTSASFAADELGFDYLIDITSVDHFGDYPRYEIGLRAVFDGGADSISASRHWFPMRIILSRPLLPTYGQPPTGTSAKSTT